MSNQYKLSQIGYGYIFTTDSGDDFIILVEKHNIEILGEFVLDFSFFPVEKNIVYKSDPKIRNTITNFLINLFKENKRYAIFYVCDSMDRKGKIRKRLFDSWFNNSNSVDFVKKDYELKYSLEEEIETSIQISLLSHTQNPDLIKIEAIFDSNLEELKRLK
ncbi:DUF6169 family protein [Aquiflexum sp.]|uniref:DUF6169 family protein n=1 Tax=Aquiflexum sp. TaxID=1872584 RepID=UPI0035940588